MSWTNEMWSHADGVWECALARRRPHMYYVDRFVSEHQLLPDVIPTGPTLDQSAPVFLEVPSPAYVTRSKPATLTCRAVHALTLFFKCNDEDVADKEHSRADFVDPQTAIRQWEVKLSVDMRAVDEYFGDYKCVCVAWSSRGGKESSSVKVTAACKYSLSHQLWHSNGVGIIKTFSYPAPMCK